MSLEARYTARLIIHRPGGDFDAGVFEKMSGGNVDSEEAKHRNAVTRKQTARGGTRTRSNIELERECDAASWAMIPTLEDAAGVDECSVIRQMVDGRGAATGSPRTFPGVVKAVNYPDYDLQGDGVGMLQVEVSTDEDAS